MESPVGAISVAQHALREMLANCAYWRTFHGASLTVAQARAKIYISTMPLIDTIIADPTTRPLAVIYNTNGVTWTKRAGPNLFTPHGVFVIELHDNAETLLANDPWANERRIENAAGLIAQSGDAGNPGLAELSNAGEYLPLSEIRGFGPDRIDPQMLPSVGDCLIYYLEIDWGGR